MKVLLCTVSTAALLTIGSAAQAVPMSYTETGSFLLGSQTLADNKNPGNKTSFQTDSVRLRGFDSSRGQLNGVNVSFNSNWNLNASVRATDTNPNGRRPTGPYSYINVYNKYGKATTSAQFTLALGSLSGPVKATSQFFHESATCSNYSPSSTCFGSDSRNGLFGGSVPNVGLFGLNYFRSPTITFNLRKTLKAFAEGLSDNDVTATTSSNNWRGNITIQYQYNSFAPPPPPPPPPGPAAVPEPATMVLFGAGLLGLAALRRRR